jgi:hypothetical protein
VKLNLSVITDKPTDLAEQTRLNQALIQLAEVFDSSFDDVVLDHEPGVSGELEASWAVEI